MADPDRGSLEDVLRHLPALLDQWPYPATVIGGIAIVARVRPRHTNDVDVVIVVPEGGAQQLLDLVHGLGWSDDPEQTRVLLEGGLLRLFRGTTEPSGARDDAPGLDVIFVDSTFLGQVVARASPLDLGIATLPVATTEDLLLLKLDANRPEDLDDILAIKDCCSETLDMAYVRTQAARLGILDRLDLYFGAS